MSKKAAPKRKVAVTYTGGSSSESRSRRAPATRRKSFGKYIVADPEICHGKLTFAGTRIFVADVLELVALGMDWDKIVWECHNRITKEAIAAAVRVASRAFIEHADEYLVESVPA